MELDTSRLPIHRIVADLNDNLGATVVAYLAGMKDRKLPYRWATGAVTPRDNAQARLMAAHQVLAIVRTAEGADIARQWFISSNPRLMDYSPAESIRESHARAVLAAARAFADGTDG